MIGVVITSACRVYDLRVRMYTHAAEIIPQANSEEKQKYCIVLISALDLDADIQALCTSEDRGTGVAHNITGDAVCPFEEKTPTHPNEADTL